MRTIPTRMLVATLVLVGAIGLGRPAAAPARDFAAPALSGPAALPVMTPASALALAGPAAADATFLYRPVRAVTNVSAYYDLDRTQYSIRDWKGYVGATWIYGRAYDQHSGTDYDGVTNDPVYAAAPGRVTAVYVDCVNTYPNGPGSFGSAGLPNRAMRNRAARRQHRATSRHAAQETHG